MVGKHVEGFRGMVAGQLKDFYMLKEQLCIESACVPGANEAVRVCCQLGLGGEVERR